MTLGVDTSLTSLPHNDNEMVSIISDVSMAKRCLA